VIHACNPSYSVSRDQEGFSSKPAWQIVYVCDTLSEKKKKNSKNRWWNGLKCRPRVQTPVPKKKKKKKKKGWGDREED
jgi:hypothetical protein